MTTSSEYSGSEILVPNCNKKKIEQIIKMRRAGMPYKTIAYKIGRGEATVRKWDRIQEKYGTRVFADN